MARPNQQDTAPDTSAGANFVANVRYLITEGREWGIGQTAGIAGLHPRTLQFLLAKGGNANPELSTIETLAEVLGVRPQDLLMDPGALKDHVAEVGLLPLPLSRFGIEQSQSRDSDTSSRSRERFRDAPKKSKRSGRTGTEGASTRWFRHSTVRPADTRPASRTNVADTHIKRTPGLTSVEAA